MINNLKNFIQNIFKIFGFKIIGIKKLVSHNSFDALHKFILKEYFEKKKDPIIFDVGANDGDSVIRFKKIFPKSRIYSFEPNDEILKNFDTNIKAENVIKNNVAVGSATEKRKFYFYNSHRISSFYPVVDGSKYQRLKVKDKKDFYTKDINVITLDEYCEKNHINNIDILKIDTQGSEAEVLAGAKQLLKDQSIKIIDLEYILGIAHDNANSLYDIENALNNYNYKLIAIESSGNIVSFSRYQTNLMYVRKDIYNKIKLMHEVDTDLKY